MSRFKGNIFKQEMIPIRSNRVSIDSFISPSLVASRFADHVASPSHPSQPAQIQQPPRQPSMEFEAYPSQQQYAMQHQGTAVYDMSGMARALPDYQMRQFVPQPYQQQYTTPSAQSNPPVMYQYQQGAQFAGQTGGGYNQNYVQHYLPQFAPNQHLRQPQGPYPHMMPGVSGPNSNFVMQHHSHNLLQPPTGGQYGQAYTSRQGVYASPQIRQDLNIHTGTTHPLYQQIHPPGRYLPQILRWS